MPRPPRAKVASSVRSRRVQSTKPPATGLSKPAKSNGAAKPNRTTRVTTRRRSARSDEIPSEERTCFMSGALPPETNAAAPTQPDPVQSSPHSRSGALDALRTSRSDAMKAKDSVVGKQASRKEPVIETARVTHQQADAVHPRPSSAIQQEPRRDGGQPASLSLVECTPSPADGSEEERDLYGLSPSGEISQLRIQEQFAARRLSQQQRAPSVQGTPAPDTSIFTKFQRRPRQSSMIRMIQRESSIGLGSEGFDDFDLPPDDESTPLNLNTTAKTRTSHSSKGTVSSGPATSSSRKRKFEEIQVPRSPQFASSPPPRSAGSRSPFQLSEADLPQDQPLPSVERHQKTDIYSDTMADPLSSSSLPIPADNDESEHRPAKQRKKETEGALEVIANVSAAPPTRRAREARANAFSTAQLQNLLPKPRRRLRRTAARNNDPFSIPTSDELHDDQSSVVNVIEEEPPPIRRRTNVAANKRSLAKLNGNAGPKEQPKPRRSRRTNVVSPQSAREAATISGPAKTKRTYGRNSLSENKENDISFVDRDNEVSASEQSDDDGGGGGVDRRSRARSRPLKEVVTSKELKVARKKFAEVDRWELSFESVDMGGTSSDWR